MPGRNSVSELHGVNQVLQILSIFKFRAVLRASDNLKETELADRSTTVITVFWFRLGTVVQFVAGTLHFFL
jgi:hypothetical protein